MKNIQLKTAQSRRDERKKTICRHQIMVGLQRKGYLPFSNFVMKDFNHFYPNKLQSFCLKKLIRISFPVVDVMLEEIQQNEIDVMVHHHSILILMLDLWSERNALWTPERARLLVGSSEDTLMA